MSYRTLIEANLTKAFNLLYKQGLAKSAILIQKQKTFDFSSGDTEETSTSSLTVKLVDIKTKSSLIDFKAQEKEIMFKSETTIDLDAFSAISIDSEEWKIGKKLENTDYIYLIKVYK